MRWRGIGEDVVRQTLERPEWEESSAMGRINRWKRIADRVLRVTFREEPDGMVVISAVFKAELPRRRGEA
jgi:hypothetical protein